MQRVLKTVVATALCFAPHARAQVDYVHAGGPLVVWVVSASTAEERARILQRKQAALRTLPTTVQQSTIADFGQTSSTYGQTSGSYGTPSANVGRNASDSGKPSSEYGQTSSSLPSNIQSVNAGDYGQTPGSFGQASSTFGIGLIDPGSTGARSAAQPLSRSETHRLLLRGVAGLSADLHVQFVDLSDASLQDALLAAQGKASFPDVVVGALPAWWEGSGFAVAMLGSLRFQDVTRTEYDERLYGIGRAFVLLRAPHPQQARAFVLWLRDGESCASCLEAGAAKEIINPVSMAVRAVGRMLNGESLGADADEGAAQFSAEMARRTALHPPSEEAIGGLHVQVDVLDAGANDRLAVVVVRAVVSSASAFGATRAVVVLRKDNHAKWKVLQISMGVPPGRVSDAGGALLAYARPVPPEKVAHVVGVAQAAPVDGDIRPLQPDLWWDNGGGASMLAVEWQRKSGAWSDTRLMLVPDDTSRVQTRVRAAFANADGEYRWRVWSVGTGGALVLSAWKTLKIVP